MKQQRQPYSVCTGQFWNGQDCLFISYTCMLATQSFLWCSVPAGGYLAEHPEGWWRGGCHSGLPVSCGLPFDTLNTPPPPTAIVITSLCWPLLHHFSINHRHSAHRHRNTILSLIKVLSYNHKYMYMWPMQLIHVLFDTLVQHKTEEENSNQK